MTHSAYRAGVVFILAFICALTPLDAYEAQGFLGAILLLAAAVFPVLYFAPPNKIDLFMVTGGLFWALAFASVFLSAIPYVSFIFFCFFSALPLSFLLAICVRDKNDFFKPAGAALAGILGVISIFTFGAYIFWPSWLAKGLAHWPLSDPNSFAALYSLAYFCALGVMLGGEGRRKTILGFVFSLLFLGTIFLTGSKGALAALVIFTGLFFAAAAGPVRARFKEVLALTAAAGVLFSALGLVRAVPVVKSPAGAFSTHMDVFGTHGPLWLSAWHIIREHFWTGTGIGTFFLYYPAYRTETYTAGFMAHNDPLQFWAEMGIFAPVLFYAFILVVTAGSWKKLTFIKGRQRVRILAPLCGLGAMVLHAHINFNFNILPILMITGLMLGFLYKEVRDAVPALPLPATGLRQGLLIMIMAGVPFFALLQTADILTFQAKQAMAQGDMERFARDLNLSGRLSLNTNDRAQVLAASLPLGVLESTAGLDPLQKVVLAQKAEGLLRRAIALNPRNASAFYSLARLYKIAPDSAQGSAEEPAALLRHALTLDPMHLGARTMLANLLSREGKKAEALEIMQAGLKWPNGTAGYYEDTALMAIMQGDAETHNTAMGKLMRMKNVKFRKAPPAGEPVHASP